MNSRSRRSRLAEFKPTRDCLNPVPYRARYFGEQGAKTQFVSPGRRQNPVVEDFEVVFRGVLSLAPI